MPGFASLAARRPDVRRIGRAWIAAAWSLVAVAALSGCGDDAPKPRVTALPNIVWIIADDQGWNDYGFMGNATVRTPNLDQLAAESAVFVNGYVPASLCRPSLATMLTGLYPHQHRITWNEPPVGWDERQFELMRQQTTLPTRLAGAGYRSFQTGKWWEDHYRNGGFTDGMSEGGRSGGNGLRIGRRTMDPIRRFVRKHRAEPFFLWYAPALPHLPHDSEERFRKMIPPEGLSEREIGYYGTVAWFDETVGELLRILDEEGLGEHTLVVYIADNGWAPRPGGEFVIDAKGLRQIADPRSKNAPYESGVRTPVVLRWPGKIAAGKRYEDLVSAIDLVPTALAAAGLPVPGELPGLSLLPRAGGGEPLARDTVFGEIFLHDGESGDDPAGDLLYRWMRQGPWKLIIDERESGRSELYDLATDETERVDLSGRPEFGERIRRLRARLDAWWNPRPH
jgi:uncharacterized sulfatase